MARADSAWQMDMKLDFCLEHKLFKSLNSHWVYTFIYLFVQAHAYLCICVCVMHKSRKSVFLLHRLVCQEVQFPVWLEHFSESRPLKEENYPTLKFGSQDQAVWFSCRVTRPVLNKSLFCAFWTQVTGCAFWCSHHSWTSDFSGQKWGAPGYYVLVHQMWNVAGCRVASSRCDHQRGC